MVKMLYKMTDVELVHHAWNIRDPLTVTDLETELLNRFLKLSGVTPKDVVNFASSPWTRTTAARNHIFREWEDNPETAFQHPGTSTWVIPASATAAERAAVIEANKAKKPVKIQR